MIIKKATSTPIYYRDLSPDMKREVMNEIVENNRNDLIAQIDNGDDVTIGYWLKSEDYHKD